MGNSNMADNLIVQHCYEFSLETGIQSGIQMTLKGIAVKVKDNLTTSTSWDFEIAFPKFYVQ